MPDGTHIQINKDKNRSKLMFIFPPMGAMRGSVLPLPNFHPLDTKETIMCTTMWEED
jgi:hypothetical protein